MKKKGMELSINFLVVLILSIVMFGLSLTLLTKILKTTTDLSESTQENLDKQVGFLSCKSSEQVCFDANKKTIERDSFAIFGLKVLNINEVQTKFFVNMSTSSPCPNSAGNKIVVQTLYEGKTFNVNRLIVLDPNKSKTIGLGVEVKSDASSGICMFDVGVYQCTDSCNSLSKFNTIYKDEVYKLSVRVP